MVAGVEVHLSPASPLRRKIHLDPEALEYLDGGPARLGEERVVEARDKQRDAHG